MKSIALVLMSIALWCLQVVYLNDAEPITLPKLRLNYVKALDDKALASRQLDLLKEMPAKPAIFSAYEGAFEALMAKHSWNPYKKLAHLNRSQKILSQAIEATPRNIEMRFLRFSIQYYLPKFLGQSNDLQTDKSVMLEVITQGEALPNDPQTLSTIFQFLLDSELCSVEEQNVLKQKLANLTY